MKELHNKALLVFHSIAKCEAYINEMRKA